eukprot:762927-Hanusia_phi.AAC.3
MFGAFRHATSETAFSPDSSNHLSWHHSEYENERAKEQKAKEQCQTFDWSYSIGRKFEENENAHSTTDFSSPPKLLFSDSLADESEMPLD